MTVVLNMTVVDSVTDVSTTSAVVIKAQPTYVLQFVCLFCLLRLHSRVVPCKGIRIPKSGKFLLTECEIWENFTYLESEILGFGIQNTGQGIRNPIPSSKQIKLATSTSST